MEVQNTRTSEVRPKRKEKTKHAQNLENTLRIPLFFGTMRLFLKFFGLHQRVPPSFVSIFCNTNGCQKIPKGLFTKGPPFTFFGTVTLFKNHILKRFFGKFFKVKGSHPFTILSLRYGADFGRSRLVLPCDQTMVGLKLGFRSDFLLIKNSWPLNGIRYKMVHFSHTIKLLQAYNGK